MIKVVEQLNLKLFDGSEQECLEQIFNVNGKDIKLINIYNNSLRYLRQEIDIADFDLIVQKEELKLGGNICDIYTTHRGLEAYFWLDHDNIYIFSFGEYQPSRFMLTIESIWEII